MTQTAGNRMTGLTAVGFDDEVTECDKCGRTELRGTVRMIDADGNEYRLGTTCATTVTGRRVTKGDAVKAGAYQARMAAAVYAAVKAAMARGDVAAARWEAAEARHYAFTDSHRAQILALLG